MAEVKAGVDANEVYAALEAFVEEIESTGGVIKWHDTPENRHLGDLYSPAVEQEDEHGVALPWFELGKLYMQACAALKREPMVDADQDAG